MAHGAAPMQDMAGGSCKEEDGNARTGAGEEEGHERLVGVGGDAISALLPLQAIAGRVLLQGS